MTICNVCTLNLRQANFELQHDAALLERVNTNLQTVGVPRYSGGVEVKHLLWLIAEGEGYERLKEAAHKGLKGLQIAPFYGCQILRPSKLLGFEDPDQPHSLEAIIAACGGESVDYPAKIKCCGFPIIQAREEVALGELIQPIQQAMDAGADAMVTPCPLCHLSLDAWQQKLEQQTGKTLPDADLPPLPADRRRRGPRGVRAEAQATRRVDATRRREAPPVERVAEADPRRIGGSRRCGRRRSEATGPRPGSCRSAEHGGARGERPRCRRKRQPARVRRGGRAVARGLPADELDG